MTGRLARAWRQPLHEHRRRQAFAAAGIALIACAVGLSQITRPTLDTRPPAQATLDADTGGAAPSPAAARSGGHRGGLPGNLRRPARRFTVDYLDWLYGRRRTIPRHAGRGLGRQLETPPRVSAAVRRREPRVTRWRGHPVGPGRWLVEATVNDGSITYPLAVVVARHAHGAVVTRIVDE